MKNIKSIIIVALGILLSSISYANPTKNSSVNLEFIKKEFSKISYPKTKWNDNFDGEIKVTVKSNNNGNLEIVEYQGNENLRNYFSKEIESIKLESALDTNETYQLKIKFIN